MVTKPKKVSLSITYPKTFSFHDKTHSSCGSDYGFHLLQTEEALVVDTVLVIDEAVTLLNEENSVAMARSRSRSRFQRQYSSCQAGSSCCNCSGQPMDRRYDGKMVLDTLKRV